MTLSLLDQALYGRPRVRFLAGELPPRGDQALVTGLEMCATWDAGLPVAFLGSGLESAHFSRTRGQVRGRS